MKNKLVLLCFIFIVMIHTAFAQIAEGIITYEEHRNVQPGRDDLKNVASKSRNTKSLLFFNAVESLYKTIDEDRKESVDTGDGFQLMFMHPKIELYCNRNERKKVSLQELDGKNYLVEDSLNPMAWKFAKETKVINGYVCKKAMLRSEDHKQNTVAWYTEKLRPYLGPEGFNTLSGTVLEINMNNGERIITAVNIEQRSLKKSEVKITMDGPRITEASFRKMRDKHIERIRASGGNIILIK
jgi:GLPGLI family protein